jgi:transposase
VDNRRFVDAVLWLARTAAPWRDLPPAFGKWTCVHARAPRRALAGVWERLFNVLSADPDVEYVLIDSTICKARGGCDGRKGGLRRRGSDARAAA